MKVETIDTTKLEEIIQGLEAVAQILRRERRVQHHTHRHDDIASADACLIGR